MRRLFSLMALMVSLITFADSPTETVLNLFKLNQSSSSDDDKYNILRDLQGDTITFDINADYASIFTQEMPDTIWIKKRPKKNPQEGKHYKLSYVYKGVPDTSNKYHTPTSEINGKRFAVLSVDQINRSPTSIYKDISMKLIDLEDSSIMMCRISQSIPFKLTISSNRINQQINSLIGNEFYLKTGNGDSTPLFQLGKLSDGNYAITIQKHFRYTTVYSDIHLYFIDENGTPINFKYEKTLFSVNPYQVAPIISIEEYQDRYVTRTIDSNVREDLAESDTVMPFSFNYIFGTPALSICSMSQSINPAKVNSYDWYSESARAPEQVMLVGGELTVRGKRFLKMIHNGKAFFMSESSVNILPDDKSKLDSLRASSPEIQEIFFYKCLSISKAAHYEDLNEATRLLNSYKKQGLAIKSWGVYDESRYTEGTSIQITFLNPTEQTIKYVSLTFQGYNSVDDPYGRPVTKKCIGPIAPDETAQYNFEYVWFTDVIKYAKIRSITVTYKNGTTKNISNANAITLPENIISVLYNPVINFK